MDGDRDFAILFTETMFDDRKESLLVVTHPVRVRPVVHAVVPYNKQYIIQSHRSTPQALALCVDGWTRPGDGDRDRGAHARCVCVNAKNQYRPRAAPLGRDEMTVLAGRPEGVQYNTRAYKTSTSVVEMTQLQRPRCSPVSGGPTSSGSGGGGSEEKKSYVTTLIIVRPR